jgi:hypothetical protein
MDGGVSEAQRLINLERYYEVVERWHAGPHGFVSPDAICGFSDPTKPGVHASCFNSVSLGFEMVGSYDVEDFAAGPGALVRDNAVFALALWHKKLGLRPDGFRYGSSGLHFHHDCMRDRHACPGSKVDRGDLVARVLMQMGQIGDDRLLAVESATKAAQPAPPPLSAFMRKGSIGPAVAALQRALGGIAVDGDFGPETETAVIVFQAAHGLAADGIVGPITAHALLDGARTVAVAKEEKAP